MARILVQCTLQRPSTQQWIVDSQKNHGKLTIQILDETIPITLEIEDWKEFLQFSPSMFRSFVGKLFPDFAVSDDNVEIVECVDREKNVLGWVPRQLVHQYNLLHRGIGMFVTRDRPILVSTSSQPPPSKLQPELYCHQRTASKRIFPSLYDMFVGGVSLAGEDPSTTARREVAEELGLVAALETKESLSPCLLTCIVCTGYNRCVVDLFCYTMNTHTEQIRWQPEEVAWGSFVPYDVVQDSACRSISRLVQLNQWPGQHPPLALHHAHSETCDEDMVPEFLDGAWKNWDFVPDGLFVWEAWLQAINKGVCTTTTNSISP
jgi:8-oxo-dGTP pyrophosphatase MutT (NUDIX family)